MAAYDAHKNFAYSTVATAPVPAATGLSLVVQSTDGAKFPAVPFNAVVFPASTNPSTTNAEIVRVTNIVGDTFTITRTQESTSARSILVGDNIVAAITAKSLTDIEGGGIGIASQAANEVIFATSATQHGRSTAFTFDGNTLANNASINGNQSTTVRNTNAGAAALAFFRGGNDTQVNIFDLIAYGSGVATSGPQIANATSLLAYHAAGLSLGATDAAGTLRFFSGGSVERARFLTGGGLALGGTTNPGAGGISAIADFLAASDSSRFTKTYAAASNAQAVYILQANAGGAGTGAGNELIRIDNRGANDALGIDNNGTRRFAIAADGSVLVGAAPTGGGKGLGTANFAADIYKNNSAYTNPDYVLEYWATGKIEKFAQNEGADRYGGLRSLSVVEWQCRTGLTLPRIAEARMAAGEAGLGAFAGGDAVLASLEEAYLYLFQQDARIQRLEQLLED